MDNDNSKSSKIASGVSLLSALAGMLKGKRVAVDDAIIDLVPKTGSYDIASRYVRNGFGYPSRGRIALNCGVHAALYYSVSALIFTACKMPPLGVNKLSDAIAKLSIKENESKQRSSFRP